MTKYCFALFCSLFILSACADQSTVQSSQNGNESPSETTVVVNYSDLDTKPRFGGCEDKGDAAVLKACSDKLMTDYISKNLKYPEMARAKGIEGKVVVSFVIEVNGSLSDIKAETNLGGGLEDEAVRVFELMNTEKQWWIPGRKNGKRQRVKLQLPISFKM